VTIDKSTWALSFARPAIGVRPIEEISAAEALSVLQGLERRGFDSPVAALFDILRGHMAAGCICMCRAKAHANDTSSLSLLSLAIAGEKD
jgi:hypothetical protein